MIPNIPFQPADNLPRDRVGQVVQKGMRVEWRFAGNVMYGSVLYVWKHTAKIQWFPKGHVTNTELRYLEVKEWPDTYW